MLSEQNTEQKKNDVMLPTKHRIRFQAITLIPCMLGFGLDRYQSWFMFQQQYARYFLKRQILHWSRVLIKVGVLWDIRCPFFSLRQKMSCSGTAGMMLGKKTHEIVLFGWYYSACVQRTKSETSCIYSPCCMWSSLLGLEWDLFFWYLSVSVCTASVDWLLCDVYHLLWLAPPRCLRRSV